MAPIRRLFMCALCCAGLVVVARIARQVHADEVARVHLVLVYAQATPTPTCTATPTNTATATATATPTNTPTITPTPTPKDNTLRISALHYDGADEYIEIANDGPRVQDLYRWRILSVVGSQEYSFPWGIYLDVGARVRVHSGPAALDEPPTDLRWQRGYIWANDGDEARLYDDKGVERDRWGY